MVRSIVSIIVRVTAVAFVFVALLACGKMPWSSSEVHTVRSSSAADGNGGGSLPVPTQQFVDFVLACKDMVLGLTTSQVASFTAAGFGATTNSGVNACFYCEAKWVDSSQQSQKKVITPSGQPQNCLSTLIPPGSSSGTVGGILISGAEMPSNNLFAGFIGAAELTLDTKNNLLSGCTLGIGGYSAPGIQSGIAIAPICASISTAGTQTAP